MVGEAINAVDGRSQDTSWEFRPHLDYKKSVEFVETTKETTKNECW